MSIISFNSVHKHFGAHDVLSGLNFTIDQNAKAGLIGPNGAGKTTVLKLILGSEEPSQGSVIRRDGARIGYVPQYPDFPEVCTVSEALTLDLRDAKETLRKAEEELGAAGEKNMRKVLNRYQIARDAYDAVNGDEAEERSARLIETFGLKGKENQQVGTLSGGERNTLSLARATVTRPDLLILDEPGNHLDYIGLAWLEDYLMSYPGAILLVSHNRYLLDRVVSVVFELESGTVSSYTGNYSDYRRTKLQKLVNVQSDYVANQKRLNRLDALVKRFEQIARNTADPAWGKRYRARRTQLEKERARAVGKPELDTRAMRVGWKGEETKADIALQVNDYAAGFGDTHLFESANLQFSCGERVALVGPNGSGKTTLLNDIVTRGDWNDNVLRIGPSLVVGYCSQNQDVFDTKKTMLEVFIELGTLNRKNTYSLLAKFLFSWNDLDTRVGALSGGEMNRLQLARLEVTKANFLILDEPTNHLDIGSREAIEEALEDFNGTLLVVSHDRYFLDKIADRVVEIRGRKLEMFDGNFSEFWRLKSENIPKTGKNKNLGKQRKAAAADTGTPGKGKTRAPNNSARHHSAGLESRIERTESERALLESEITKAFEAGDHQLGREKSNKLSSLSKLIEKLYEEWEG
jgi:ATP-binding cassette, subfamily F, member 3